MTASPSTAPRSIRLQIWLPLALLIVCALVFFLLTLLEHWHAQQDLHRFSQRTAHSQLLSTVPAGPWKPCCAEAMAVAVAWMPSWPI